MEPIKGRNEMSVEIVNWLFRWENVGAVCSNQGITVE